MTSQYQQFLTTRQENPSAIVFIADETLVDDGTRYLTFDQHAVLVASHCQLQLNPIQVSDRLAVEVGQADIDILKANEIPVIIVTPEVAHG